jgi:hypothetical protein
MVRKTNIVFAINIILKTIIDQLELTVILIIIYINLYFLYEYLVKLETTKKKCFMIDIIVIR